MLQRVSFHNDRSTFIGSRHTGQCLEPFHCFNILSASAEDFYKARQPELFHQIVPIAVAGDRCIINM